MSKVALNPGLHMQLLPLADIVDPPRRGRTVGYPLSVARVEAQIPATYHRGSDGTEPPLGWSVSATYARVDGEVDIRGTIAAIIAARLDCPPGLAVALEHVPVTLPGVGQGATIDPKPATPAERELRP